MKHYFSWSRNSLFATISHGKNLTYDNFLCHVTYILWKIPSWIPKRTHTISLSGRVSVLSLFLKLFAYIFIIWLTALYCNLPINVSFALFIPTPPTYFHSFIYVTNILRTDSVPCIALTSTKATRITPAKSSDMVIHFNYKTQRIK